MGAMLCTMVPEASRRATGNGPERLKKLAQLLKFKVKEAGTNTPQMINATALNTTACVTHLKIRIQLAGVTALDMIDSGANGNFMSRKFATNHRIPGLPKERSYQLTVVDGTPLNQDEGMVKEKTLPLKSQIHGKNLGRITFDLVSIPHKVILGIPWLEKVNPSIDWNFQKITIGKEKSRKTTPKHGKTLMIKICKISQKQMRKIQQQEPQKVLTVWIKPVSGQLNATQEEDEARAKIPRVYQEFYTMFKEEAHEKLPEHRDWDHEIPIEEGKKPTYGPIYALSETELKALREYLDKNLKKEFIQPFTSPAGYPILFFPKKDEKLRLCVDYRQLNAITVKNRYLLPLILELQDRIQGSQ